MSDAISSDAPLESQRVPLEREVLLEFEHFSNFIREYSANISLGGMFVKSGETRLPGTVFRFEIRLAEDSPLVAGLAKVLWVREAPDGDDRPAGMGVQFLQLEAEGRRLIERIVREHTASGGRPFDLEQARAAAVPPPPPPEAPPVPAAAQPPPAARDDDSAAIELPVLDELLQEAERAPGRELLGTPPRGWRPGTSAERPRTRPQLLINVAIAAVVLAGLGFLALRYFTRPPELPSAEVEPRPLPRAEAGPEAAAEEPPAPPEPRFTAVEEISWQRRGSSAVVVVRVDGSLPEGSWSEGRMTDPPRHLVKLLGATRPYPTQTFEVGFGGVRQLRTGYHAVPGGDEQHVVIDLVDPRVVLEGIETEPRTLRFVFRRIG